jgi:hypothetical protein
VASEIVFLSIHYKAWPNVLQFHHLESGVVPLWGANISLADTSVAGGVHLPFTYIKFHVN